MGAGESARMKTWYEALADDSGATALLVAVLLLMLLGVAAVVIDAGMLYAERRSMQTAADAAALAGVQELPADPGNASTVADSYVSANPAGPEASHRTFTVSSTNVSNDTLTVHICQPSYALKMASVLGVSNSGVGAQATAVLTSPSAYGSGVMPFGLMSSDSATGTAAFGYAFNETVVLRQGAGSGESGNFQLVELAGTSDLRSVILEGGASATIGETIRTHPGVNASLLGLLDHIVSADSRSFESVVTLLPDGTASISDYSCAHLIIVPVIWSPGPPPSYSWSDLRGRSDVQVLSFAWMWVDSAEGAHGPAGQGEITGRFIRPLTPEEVASWGAPDPYGAIAFRLTN
jgi:Flp pilus assembly protein TadG